MAKKAKSKGNEQEQEKQFDYEATQKRMEKYYKACEKEKKGKAAVWSIIGFSILCFIVVLVIVLKMSGVGTTIVFDSNGKQGTTVYTDETAEGTTLADYLADQLADNE